MLFLPLVIAACGSKKTASEETTVIQDENRVIFSEAEMKTGGIVVGHPIIGKSTSYIKVSGEVGVPPQNMVSISFPPGGYLSSTTMVPGRKVRKGESIAVMKDQSLIQLQQDFLVARSKVGFLAKEYERQRLLNQTKTTSDKVFEQTESEYRAQRILMNSLKEKLLLIHIDPASLSENNIRRSVNIYSPIDGYVSEVNVNIGKYVSPTEVLFELVNPRDLLLTLRVFEKDLPGLQAGQRVKVNLVNEPATVYEAVIQLISKSLDDTRSAKVQCRFVQPPADLLPGMFANAIIETTSSEALLVPEEAVVRWGNDQYVFSEKADRTFEMTRVDAGTTEEGRTEIRTGISSADDRIIIKNAYTALMKLHNKAEE